MCSRSSAAPLALALFTLWPLRIAIYGQDLFRTGGTDWGPRRPDLRRAPLPRSPGARLLLVVGVRSVHGWSWARSLATVALAAALPALIVLATLV